MRNRVRDVVARYNMIECGDRVLVAVSGGADSLCLLLVLRELEAELGITLEVIHVEHGIRGDESIADARFVEELCGSLGVRCHMYHVDAPAYAEEHGYSIEEAARVLRYECFDKHSGTCKIAIAHNMDDNAETVLYNMARGTGPEGLRGIKRVRDSYIRPLIECRREEIEEYMRTAGIEYRTDSTNALTTYARNNIRHNVMPVLTEINGGVIDHISRLCELQDMMMSYIDKRVEEAFCRYCEGSCLYRELLNEESIIVKSVIKRWLEHEAGTKKDIASIHIDAVHELLTKESGKSIDLPYELRAIAGYDCVKLTRSRKEEAKHTHFTANINDIGDKNELRVGDMTVSLTLLAYTPDMEIVAKNYTKMLDYDKIIEKLCIRNRQEGDYLVINAAGDKKSLSRYMIDAKIPSDERDERLLVCDGRHVMYVVGGRISEYYKIDADTTRVLKIEVTTPEGVL